MSPTSLSNRSPLQLVQLKLTIMQYFIETLRVDEETAESMTDACLQAGLKSEKRRAEAKTKESQGYY